MYTRNILIWIQAFLSDPYTNSCYKWNTFQYSTSYIRCSPGYRIKTFLISHLHKLLSSIIYRDIKTQDDCLKIQQDVNSAARLETDCLMAFHSDKCSKLSHHPTPHPSPNKNKTKKDKTKQAFRNNQIYSTTTSEIISSCKIHWP